MKKFIKNLFRDRRLEQMQIFANELDMDFTVNDDLGLAANLTYFKLFQLGKRRRIKYLMSKHDLYPDAQFHLFDYDYEISSGESSQTVETTVFFANCVKLEMPFLTMKPEHFFHKVGKFLRLTDDINFEQYPEFSKKYHLKGKGDQEIRAAFESSSLLKLFTAEDGWTFEAYKAYFILYKKGQQLDQPEISKLYQMGFNLAIDLIETK